LSAPPEDHARRLAIGALVQQSSQVLALASLAAVLTVLARTLPLAAFGVYALVSSFVTYLLVVQGAVSGATLQALGRASNDAERDRVFTTAVLVLGLFGVVAGVLIGAGGIALLGVLQVPHGLQPQARSGVLALAAITLIGWPVRTFSDALRGLQRFALASVCEAAAYIVFTVAMLLLALVIKPPLWVLIAVGGVSPVLIGGISGIALLLSGLPIRVRRRSFDPVYARTFLRLSMALLAISGSDIFISSLDRTILGLFRPASVVALYEGAVRPNTLVRALAGSLVRTVLPASAQFHAAGDVLRLRALVLRGTRYVLAATLPVTIVLMVLAGPILEVWLGKRFDRAATALAIFTGTWILGANNSVIGSALIGVGRQRELIAYTWGVAVVNVALSVGLTPLIGLDGVVVGTTAAYVAFFPMLLRIAVAALPITVRDIAREAWLPAYSLGAALAAALVVVRLTLSPATLGAVAATGVLAVFAYWAAFWILWLAPDERVLIKALFRRSGRS
jgi:O-antigen/teichoic acid export membrane protein